MNVVVALNDGSRMYPSYAPDNSDVILEFYFNAVIGKRIAGYVAKMNDGTTYSAGLVL